MRDDASTLSDRPAAYGVIEKCLLENRDHKVSAMGRVFGARPVHPSAHPWFIGALGELAVAQVLSRLDSEWTVIHSVPIGVGESDVDHLVIGPAGVFAINTKHHAGKKIWVADRRILVAGQSVDYLRNSRSERLKVKRMLELATRTSAPVEAILAFVGTESITFKQRPTDVTVVSSDQLLRHLRKCDRVLSSAQTQALVDSALQIRTWHPTAGTDFESERLADFESLRRASTVARMRRLLWAALATVAAIGIAWLLLRIAMAGSGS